MFKIAHAKEQSNLTVPSMETAYIDYPINDVVTPPQTATQIRQTAFRQEIGIGDDDY